MNKKENTYNKEVDFKKKFLELEELNELYVNKFQTIYQLTNAISENASSEEIIKILEFALRDLLNIKNASLFVKDAQWKLSLNFGFEFDLESKELDLCIVKSNGFEIISQENKVLNKYDYLIPVLHKNNNLGILLLEGVPQEFVDCSFGDKFGYIISIVNLAIVALENKKLWRQSKLDKKVQEEIELAAEVQKKLVPEDFPKNESYEFSGRYIPFETVGGDYYDLIELDKDNIAFCICDVSGKGISAGMLMSNFQASLRTLLSRNLPLKELVKQLNDKFLQITKQDRYISMFIGKYNLKTRVLEYVNAGHNPPIIKNDDELLLLEKGCCILGIINKLPYVESDTVRLKKDALLVMYTDGFSEIQNNKGIEFGIENISNNILKDHNEPLETFVTTLMNDFVSYRGTNKTFDDISLLCAKFPYNNI